MSSSKTKRSRPETDVLGHVPELPAAPRRVVSLVPSLTETLFEIGAGDAVIGVTDYCIFPDLPADIARLGGTKNPDIERIRKLRPDLVYVNVEENLRRHAEAIEQFAPVFATEPQTVRQVRELIAQLGRIHGRERQARNRVERLDAILDSAGRSARSFTFVCPIWKDPWMWCGGDTYVSDLVTVAGGKNLLADRERYPKIGIEDVLGTAPDVVFLPDEPFAFRREDAETLRGMVAGSVVGPFAGHLFTWHGVRTIAGLEFLMEVVRTLPDRGEEVARGQTGTLEGTE